MKSFKVFLVLIFLSGVLVSCGEEEPIVVEEDLSVILGFDDDTEEESDDTDSEEDSDSSEDTEEDSDNSEDTEEDSDNSEDTEEDSDSSENTEEGTDTTDTEDESNTTNPTSGSDISLKGNFVSDSYPTSGIARVIRGQDGKLYLVFTEFKTSSGPDLDVYFATDNKTKDYIDLGALKGTEGQFAYEISEEIDFEKYNYVLVWCDAFSVNFGYAILEK